MNICSRGQTHLQCKKHEDKITHKHGKWDMCLFSLPPELRFFFNTVFCWLFGDFHIIQPWSHSLPSSPRSAPTLVTSPLPSQIKKEGEERKINLKVQLRCSYIQWSTVNAPMASLLKKIESFPLTPLPEAVSYGELHFSMLSLFIHLFGFFFYLWQGFSV